MPLNFPCMILVLRAKCTSSTTCVGRKLSVHVHIMYINMCTVHNVRTMCVCGMHGEVALADGPWTTIGVGSGTLLTPSARDCFQPCLFRPHYQPPVTIEVSWPGFVCRVLGVNNAGTHWLNSTAQKIAFKADSNPFTPRCSELRDCCSLENADLFKCKLWG